MERQKKKINDNARLPQSDQQRDLYFIRHTSHHCHDNRNYHHGYQNVNITIGFSIRNTL